MLSINFFENNADDSLLFPLFKTMLSKRNFECDDYDDDRDKNRLDCSFVFLGSFLLFSRKSKSEHQQLSWFAHVEKLQYENIFSLTY